METVQPKGATYVSTQPGETLSVEPTVGHLVLSNGARVQVKRGWQILAHNGTREVLAADAAKLFRILSLVMTTGGTAPTLTFKSATTEIGPLLTPGINASVVVPFSPYGLMQTNAINEALNVTVSSSADVSIIFHYIELTTDLFDLL